MSDCQKQHFPQISIIVPVYEVEPYLDKCLSSLVSQTYPHWEAVLVNDGSEDGGGAVCDAFAEQDNRFVVIHQNNKGVSEARNTGIERSSGNYLVFLDGDDWVHPRFLEELVRVQNKHGGDLVFPRHVRVANEEEAAVGQGKGQTVVMKSEQALACLFEQERAQFVVACWKLIPRTLLGDLRFLPGRFREDEFFTYRLLGRASRIVKIEALLAYYRQRRDSIMGVGFVMSRRLDLLDAWEQRAHFLKERKNQDLCARAVKELFYYLLDTSLRAKREGAFAIVKDCHQRLQRLRPLIRKTPQEGTFRGFSALYYLFPQAVLSWQERRYAGKRRTEKAAVPNPSLTGKGSKES